MMKKIILFFLLLPLLVVGQTQTENYYRTTVYKVPVTSQDGFADFNLSLSSQNLLDIATGGGSASGSISMNNNILALNFTAWWSPGSSLKLGTIKPLNTSPAIPDTDLGPILSAGVQTGYFAKIQNNSLVFYSPSFLSGINTTLTVTLPGLSTVNHNVSFGNPYLCVNSAPTYSGGGSVIIVNGVLTLTANGSWSSVCNLKTGYIVNISLNGGQTMPNIELGTITSNLGLPTIYKAKIQNSQLIFYATATLPAQKWSAAFTSSTDYSSTVQTQDKSETIVYYDGLGREIQQIESGESPSGKNIVRHSDYNEYGLQEKEYLPYRSTNSGLNYEPQALASVLSYYANPTVNNTVDPSLPATPDPNFEATQAPFSEKLFEQSPLARVLESASPGNDWQLSSGHTVKTEYKTNSENEVRKFKVIYPIASNTESSNLKAIGYYLPGQLYKTVTKDENWIASDLNNKTTQEFKDQDGHVVLKRNFNNSRPHDTYYVYDVYGNLAYVIPPLASDAIDTWSGGQAEVYRNYPWTKMVEVDKKLADEYGILFSEYKNEFILTRDLFDKYGGQGGFSLNTNENEELVLTLNIATLHPAALQNGEILSLEEIGNFKDVELGRLSGEGYEYIFSISKNSLFVKGEGKISQLNASLNGNQKLVYSKNYPWPVLTELDPTEFKNYMNLFDGIRNQDQLSARIDNNYEAYGGLTLSVDENDIVSYSLNISAIKLLSLKNGLLFTLDTERRITDRELGTIKLEGINYRFGIKENGFYIEGKGNFLTLNSSGIRGPLDLTGFVPQDIQEGLIYEFHYDSKNQVVEKRVPGKGWEYTVYDKLDRISLTQDANLRLQNKWIFTKYDAFSRNAYTGQFTYISSIGNTNSALRKEVQNYINGSTQLNETKSTTGFQNSGITVNYTNTALPIATAGNNFEVFTVNYYDDYSFKPYGTAYTIPTTVFNTAIEGNVKSLATGSLTRILGIPKWVVNIVAYDKKLRKIWSKTENSYVNSSDVVENKLDFTGKILESITTHNKTGATVNLAVTDKYVYDHADRLLKHTEIIGNHEELIVFNKYNELGNVMQKKVGSTASSNNYALTSSLQKVDYTYNIRGWLTKLNDPLQTLTDDLFAYKINYNRYESGNPGLYNGNIPEVLWRNRQDNLVRNYKFDYDGLNRLKNANYSGGGLVQNFVENYTENNISYDKNGNIKHLERYGVTSSGNAIDMIDKLQYSYMPKSNKLLNVNDATIDSAGFKDGVNPGDDYAYDMCGNIIIDANKGITSIVYNHLNLPEKIVFDNMDLSSPTPKVIQYVYDAAGRKMSKKVTRYVNPFIDIKLTEYSDQFIYENNSLQFFTTPEGYVTKENNQFIYVYQFKDHQNSVRLSYRDINLNGSISNNEIVEDNNYYAFGLKHKGYGISNSSGNSLAEKFKYNEKEWQEELGLNTYDYGFRQYMPDIGRWMQSDPLLDDLDFAFNPNDIDESDNEEMGFATATTLGNGGGIYNPDNLNPYTYGYNDPIRFDDPDGRCPTCLIGAIVGAAVDYGTQVASNYMEGKTGAAAWTDNISLSSIALSAAEGALTQGGSAVRKLAIKGAVAVINNTVDVNSTGGVKVEKNVSNVLKNTAIDLSVKNVMASGSKLAGSNKLLTKASNKVVLSNTKAVKIVKTVTRTTTRQATATAQKLQVVKTSKMVSKGVKNLQAKTVENAATAKSKKTVDALKKKSDY